MSWDFLKITLAAPKKAEIVIYEYIGPKNFEGKGVDASSVKAKLDQFGELDEITLRINSPGGNVFHGLAIYNLLATHPARKIVYVDGLAASAASLIAMAGDEIVMNSGSLMMVHEASMIVSGQKGDLENAIRMLESVNSSCTAIYAQKTGLSEEVVRSLLKATTWMTDAQAVEKKFAHRINSSTKAAAATLDPQQFSNAPDWVKARCVAAPTGSGSQETPSMTTQTPAPAPATPAPAATAVTTSAATSAGGTPVAAAPAPAAPAATVPAATAPVAAPAATAPVAPVLSAADLVAQERERSSKIVALCGQAGHPELAAKWIEDPAMTVEAATSQLFSQVCSERAPLAAAAGTTSGGSKDPTAEFQQEYARNQALYAEMGVSVEEYVESCLVTAGEKKLATASKK